MKSIREHALFVIFLLRNIQARLGLVEYEGQQQKYVLMWIKIK